MTMYTDEDLTTAVKAGIFSEDAVTQFRLLVSEQQSSPAVDEENFRLISGFNDIFVVIACGLLLISIAWLGLELGQTIGALCFAAASWFLAEFFVKRRRMALPAIVLLGTFIGGSAWAAGSVFLTAGEQPNTVGLLSAGIAGAVAARFHWLRFKVPITVAFGVATVIGAAIAIFTNLLQPETKYWLTLVTFISGVFAFVLAMYWDAQDTLRQTRKADVAFWLHLLAAPLIVHPVFTALGVLEGHSGVTQTIAVITLYICLAVVSIAIDRRALMVSALIYVLFAFTTLFKTYGVVSLGFATTGLVIGSALLLLSAYWHASRGFLTQYLPKSLLGWLPALR